jgi:hypothetical protein
MHILNPVLVHMAWEESGEESSDLEGLYVLTKLIVHISKGLGCKTF